MEEILNFSRENLKTEEKCFVDIKIYWDSK